MKKTPSPNLHQSSQRKQKNANLQVFGTNNDSKSHNPKTHSALKSFKYAVKKCAAVFSLIIYGKRKTASNVVGNNYERKNTSKVRGMVSCKYDENEKFFCFLFNLK